MIINHIIYKLPKLDNTNKNNLIDQFRHRLFMVYNGIRDLRLSEFVENNEIVMPTDAEAQGFTQKIREDLEAFLKFIESEKSHHFFGGMSKNDINLYCREAQGISYCLLHFVEQEIKSEDIYIYFDEYKKKETEPDEKILNLYLKNKKI